MDTNILRNIIHKIKAYRGVQSDAQMPGQLGQQIEGATMVEKSDKWGDEIVEKDVAAFIKAPMQESTIQMRCVCVLRANHITEHPAYFGNAQDFFKTMLTLISLPRAVHNITLPTLKI